MWQKSLRIIVNRLKSIGKTKMSLKQVKKNYTALIKTFADVGVTLTESQKDVLDNFMVSIEKTMNESRDNAIRATKKIVEEKLGAEYQKVVESIIKHQKEVNDIAGKIQDRVTQVNESQKIANAVDSYLDMYLEEVLPKKTIVDYKRMQRLEQIHESLKDMLCVSEADVEDKVEKCVKNAEDKAKKEKKEVEEARNELAKRVLDTEKKLNESKAKIRELETKNFIFESTKNLPDIEAAAVSKKLAKMSIKEAKQNFKQILESVRCEMDEENGRVEDEKNLEEAIADIIEGKNSSEKKTDSNEDAEETENDSEAVNTDQDETEAENESDEVEINESIMQSWIETLNRITPKR